MKVMFFLLIADQKRYSFLFYQLRDRYNVGRDEYPVTMTSALNLLIRTDFGINEKKSTHEYHSGIGGSHPNGCIRHTFVQ